METEEDLTSLDAYTESPEITSVPSCSSSLSTSTISSQDKPEMLMSLLLQIQQFHTAETQKLHEKNNKWKTKCIKLAEVANSNANAAKRYFKHSQRLVIKVNELEHQLKALQSQSHLVGIRSENAKQVHPPIKGADLSNKPSNQGKVLRNHDLQHEAQSIVSSKPLSKLTSKKTRKKVRYSEISPTAMRTKQSSEVTAHVVPETAKIGPFDCQKLNNQVTGTPQVARILAPDTCPSPTIPSPSRKMNPTSGATPSGHDKTNPSTARPVPWIEETGHAFTIPETLGMAVGDVTTSIIDLTDENLCAPVYESTPVWEKRNISSVLESSKNRGEDRFIQDLSMKKLFPETPDGQKLLVTTIPRSESQYPVDLYNTQVKSPTFCGGESLLTTPEIADSSTGHRNKVTVCKNEPVPFRGDNYDLCNQDETCESEDSILLLGQRAMVSATKTGDSQVVSRSKSDQDDQREEIVMSRDSKKKSAEVRNETTPAKDLLTSTFKKKKRYHPGDSSDSFGEETVLPDASELGKENSPECLDDLSSCTSPNLFSGEKQREKVLNCLEKSAVTKEKVIGQKSLKQSKLSKSMFKASANRPLSLLQKYNGGDAAGTNVESQLDTYLNQAIKLSLVEQKKSAHGGTERTNKSGFKRRRVEGAVSPPKDASVGFKIPSIPHQKKQRQSVSPMPNREHLPHSLEFTSTPQDLNGSIDPLMDLTRLESDGASSPDEMDLSREEGYPRSGRGDSPGQEAEFEGDEGNDSCVDLFQEDEEYYEDEEVIDEEAVEVVEMEEEEEEEEEEAGDEGVDEDSGGEMDRSVDKLDVTGYINNFDKVPEKNEQPNFKYTEVVRKRDERQKLKGFGCKECDRFYGNLKLTDAEREVRMKECSRHRAQFSPPNTPDHYWSIGFPDTQTCIQRGYINEGGNSPDRRVRKKNKYKLKRILGKEDEEDGNEN